MARLGKRPDGTQASKKGIGSVYPDKVFESSPGLKRIEAFLAPSKLKKRFLFGVPLVSPVTQDKITTDDLKDYIQRAASMFEVDTKVSIAPVVHRFRLPFDPITYKSFIYLEVPVKPIQQVLNMAITSASYTQTGEANENSAYPRGQEIYTMPNEWLEMGNATKGIINVNPINPAFSAIGTNAGVAASGATILQFIGQQGWVPAYWNIECICGLGSMDGRVPMYVNEAIGAKATILLMDQLIPQYRIVNQSLSVDGLGQSVSNQGYALLQDKRDKAEEKYGQIVEKIKGMTANKVFSSNV